MADGDYERRGPREAELKRLKQIIESVKAKHASSEATTPRKL